MARKVAPQLDFTEVEPVPYRKTLTFVNAFVIHTVHFLNRFATLCEEKLMQVSTQIDQLGNDSKLHPYFLYSLFIHLKSILFFVEPETIMNLLEAKLQSVPEAALESSGSSTQQASQQQQNSVNNVNNQQQEKQVESGGKKIKDDPRFAKYFTMLKVGIPIDRIQEKMMMEGVDPNILSNPDAPIPRMFFSCS
jgi:WASH complex subunit CCDC53